MWHFCTVNTFYFLKLACVCVCACVRACVHACDVCTKAY